MTEKLSQIDFDNKKKIFDLNFADIKQRIKVAAESVGKREEDIKLLAATKTVPVELVNYAISKGINLIGENRVQEFLQKEPELELVERHFIGRLQTNKVKQIVGKVSLIHSVDSFKLAEEISKRSKALGITSNVLIEVNVGDEESKSGVNIDNAEDLIRQVAKLEDISILGLMAIPPLCDGEEIYSFFNKMHKLYIDILSKKIDNVNMVYLSMGMSNDFEEAIKAGANIVRIGSLLFGERVYNQKHK